MHNPGDIIAQKYQVLRLLGQGGMSNIYLCKAMGPAGTAQWVIKEMTVAFRDPDDQERAVKLFKREAEILQKLHHHNLPRVIDLFVAGNQYYFVMEYVEGEDLGRLLARHPSGFDERQVAAWGVEIATVLYYLHCQKPPIIFRDVKPSNIMISHGTVKLIDFGIARHYDHFKKKDTMRIGSPGYAPPEQYSGQTDPRSDIYSLGVTMHQLLTGRDPSETQTPFKLPGVRTLNPRVSASMEAIIEKATEMDQARRYKSALEMKRALQAVLGVQSVPLPDVAPVDRPPAPGPARPVAPASPFASTVGGRTAPPAVAAGMPAQPPRAGAPPTMAGDAPPWPNPLGASTRPGTGGVPPRLGPPAVPAPQPNASRPTPPTAVSKRSAIPPSAGPAGAPALLRSSPPPGRPNRPGFLGGLFRRTPTAPPAKRSRLGSRLRMAAVLLVLAAIGGWMHQDELIRLGRQWLAARPTPTRSAPVLPAEPTHRALALLRDGRAVEAMDALDEVRARQPSDGLAALAWNDGLAQLAAPARTVTLQAILPGGAEGAEWVRGLALEQRELNKQGGVQGRLVVLLPDEYGESASSPPGTGGRRPSAVPELFTAAPDVAYLAHTAASEGALAAVAYLPGPVAALAAEAYAKAGIPLLLTSARPASAAAVLFATRFGWDALEKALAAAATDALKPARAAVVALPGVPSDAGSRLAGSLGATFAGVKSWSVDGPPQVPADLLKLKPDLVVVMGEPEAEAHWIAAARAAGMAAAFLAGPELFVEPGTTLPDRTLRDLVGSAHLYAVTPTGGDRVEAARFGLSYDRVYGMNAPPGYWAAAASDALGAWARAMSDPSVEWTARGVRQALAQAFAHAEGVLTGTHFDGTGGSWSLHSFQNGAWKSVKAAMP